MGCREKKTLINEYNRIGRLLPTVTDIRKHNRMVAKRSQIQATLSDKYNYIVEE